MIFRGPRHIKKNFRGNDVIATAGVVFVPVLAVAWLVSERDPLATAMAVAGIAMGVLGFIDDVYGDRRAGGLIGHARALLKGEFTTGMLKAAGGAVVGLLTAWYLGYRDPWVVPAGAVVALASNLANLFDLRPGRAIKVWAPLAVWLAVVSTGARTILAALGAAVAAFLIAELRETVMLGDTGAGLLGAVLGVGLIAVVGHLGLLIGLAVLLVLTLASEKVSFSRVIEALPPLHWYDRLGRKP